MKFYFITIINACLVVIRTRNNNAYISAKAREKSCGIMKTESVKKVYTLQAWNKFKN